MRDEFLTDAVSVLRLDGSAVPVSITGTTVEQVAASILIPAGLLGPNSAINLYHSYTLTNNGNGKSPRLYANGNLLWSHGMASLAWGNFLHRLDFRGSLQSQIMHPVGTSIGFGQASTGGFQAFAYDLSGPVLIEFRVLLSNAADVFTLERWCVTIEP